jgi:hypothetical protein
MATRHRRAFPPLFHSRRARRKRALRSSSATGPAFIGKAEFVSDNAVHDYMIYQIPRKYWFAWMDFFGPKRSKFDSGQIVTIRITPERDLPDGFASQPGTPAPALNDKTSSSLNPVGNDKGVDKKC